jgi:hypothetical protein
MEVEKSMTDSSGSGDPTRTRFLRVLLIDAAVLIGILAPTPSLANWWIVRSSDEKCLVVDIEPTPGDEGVTRIGKEAYSTEEEAEADLKRLCRNSEAGFGR